MTETFETTATGASAGRAVTEWPHGTSLNEMAQDLLSRFEIVRSIGLSGASHLFFAHDRKGEKVDSVRGDQVILKLLTTDAATDPEQVQLFHLEARAATQLSHANIVRVTEAHGVGGLHLCVIELKPGVETLRSRLDRTAWFEIRDAVSIIHNIVSALDYAHRSGIVHLNIAPENVLLDSEGVAFLTGFGIPSDLGLARASRLRSKSISTQYQSPEQAVGGSVDCRSDLYSAGVLLFEMLTDRTPFNAEDAQAIRHKQMARPAPTVQLFRPDTPEWVSQVVRRLLEKSPGDRIQSARELLSELNAVHGCTSDGRSAAIQSPRPQTPSVNDETAATRELPGTESNNILTMPGRLAFDEGRELIPDDIDLVGLAVEGVVDLGTGPENAGPLDFLDQQFFSSECSQVDESSRRDFFEPPLIEVIAPAMEPLQPAGSRFEHTPEPREPPRDQETVDARKKESAILPSEPGARHPKRLVAALLCLLALATAGYVANVFKPPASSRGSEGDTTRTLAGDTEATKNETEMPSPTEAQGPVVQNEYKAARVGLRVERRSNKSVKRYARSGWRSSTRWTRATRRGRR